MVNPYQYSLIPHVRRHGPAGYSSYESYRPWLEDEFWFRCVYCLRRMVWTPAIAMEIDHLAPVSQHPELECEYDNLVLSCQFCNNVKRARIVHDPCHFAYGQMIVVEPDGSVSALTIEGKSLINSLRLNHPYQREERLQTMRILEAIEKHDQRLFEKMMGFPKELPDLEVLKPQENRRPDGIAQSCLVLRRRGELPLIY